MLDKSSEKGYNSIIMKPRTRHSIAIAQERSLLQALLYGFAFLALVFAVSLCCTRIVQANDTVQIAAIVNEDAISQSDVLARTKLIIVTSGLPNKSDIREKLRPQVVSDLVDEQIIFQEASKNDIEISEDEVENAFVDLAKKNKLTEEKLKDILRSQNIPQRTLKNKLRAELAWSRVVSTVLRPQVRVSANDIADRLHRLQKQIGRTEYLLAEIFLPVDGPANEKDVSALAQRLSQELRLGKTSFEKVAAQFSKSAGAVQQGGMLGWVQEGQLDDAVGDAVMDLKTGDVSLPIRTAEGFHIILLRNQRIISAENLPNEDIMANQIGLERLDRLQRRHMMDLKMVAFIERRA